jgi:hypothetical protein
MTSKKQQQQQHSTGDLANKTTIKILAQLEKNQP